MTKKLREFIKNRDNFTCCICGNSSHVEPNLLLEIDHIIPRSLIKDDSIDNKALVLKKCNQDKKASYVLPSKFRNSE